MYVKAPKGQSSKYKHAETKIVMWVEEHGFKPSDVTALFGTKRACAACYCFLKYKGYENQINPNIGPHTIIRRKLRKPSGL